MDLADALFAAGRHAEAEAEYERGLVARARRRDVAARDAGGLAGDPPRARAGELPAGADPGFVSRAMARGFDIAHKASGWLDVLGTPGRRLASVGVLLLIALFMRVSLVVLPHYVAHHRLHDEVVRLSRMPTEDDSLVRQGVLDAIRRLGTRAVRSLRGGSGRSEPAEHGA